MKKILTVATLFAMHLGVVSCLHSGRWVELCGVEALMWERPDSALTSLRGIDTLSLRGKEEYAKYSLLYAMALDRNGIDTSDADVILPAVKYYLRYGMAEERARSLYYQGRIYENGGEYSRAIVAFTEALPYLDEIDDRRFHGMLYAAMARIYNLSYDHYEAVEYSEKEHRIFSTLGGNRDACLADYNYAVDCTNAGLAHRADSIYRELLSQEDIPDDLLPMIQGSYAMFLAGISRDYATALRYFTEAISSAGGLNTYGEMGAYAYVLSRTGDIASALQTIESIRDPAPFEYYSWKHQIDSTAGDYRSAYENLKHAERYKDTLVSEILRQSVVKTQRDLFLEQRNFFRAESEISRLWMLIIIISTLSGAIIATFIVLHVRRRAKEEKTEMRATVERVYAQLKASEDALGGQRSLLRSDFVRQYRDRFSFLRTISEIVVDRKTGVSEELSCEMKYKKIQEATAFIYADREGHAKLEDGINRGMNDIMKKFRGDFPDLKADDYRLFAYECVGFGNDIIMILLRCQSFNALYSRKYRLKKKVQDLPENNANRGVYMAVLIDS